MADVEVERVGQVALLRLNRVDQRNAIGGELLGLLIEEAEAADRDPEVRALVTTGNGPMYCVGADLGFFSAATGLATRWPRLM